MNDFAANLARSGLTLDELCTEFAVSPDVVDRWRSGADRVPTPVMQVISLLAKLPLGAEQQVSAHVPPTSVKEDRRQTLVSLFSGAGGLDLGLEEAGFETLLANEIEPYACESLRANQRLRALGVNEFDHWFEAEVLNQRCYRKISNSDALNLRSRLFGATRLNNSVLQKAHIVERDVRDLSAAEILQRVGKGVGEIDLLAGGPPCQPFSRAGKRELVDCDKGQLFLDFVRLVDGIRPRWFLFENVKGLVIHKADVANVRCGHCHRSEIVSFEDRAPLKDAVNIERRCSWCGITGSHAVVWEKKRSGSLDIIQHEFEKLGYRCEAKVLDAADYGAPQRRERLFIIGSRDGEKFRWPDATHGETDSSITPLFDRISRRSPWVTLKDALYGDGHWKYGPLDSTRATLWVKNVVRPHDEPVTWTLNRPAPTIGAHQSAKLAIAPLGVPEAQLARQQWHVLGRRQGDSPPVFVEHEYLTDVELLKLQTFPASWYLHGTRMERAFQIGNAVPPTLARAVGEAILDASNLGGASDAISFTDSHVERYTASV